MEYGTGLYIGIVTFALIWVGLASGLCFVCQKLAGKCSSLQEQIDRMNRDLSGVCAAAINVDRRLYQSDDQMKNVLKQLENFERPEENAHPYHSAISKVKKGVDPQSLVEECGFSQGEAELMVRLYGSEPDGNESCSTVARSCPEIS